MQNTFGINLIPPNESARLNKLKEYKILDTTAHGPFKHIAGLAAHMFDVPIGLISLVDSNRVWFKGNVGLEGTTEMGRGESLCSIAVLSHEVTVFEDTLKEPCLLANPLVAGAFGLRFYAAAPLVTHDHFNIGVLCVVDKKPRAFSVSDKQTLKYLANMAMEELGTWKFERTSRYA